MYVCGSLITLPQYFHPYFLIVLASDSTLAWLLSRVLRDIVTLMDSMQTLSANHNGQTTSQQLQWGNNNKNVFKNGYRTKERQMHMTCLNFREISNARVYMLCLVCMICNPAIMANSQWPRSIRLIFHLQANTKMKVDLEWCWFKRSILKSIVVCNMFCNNLGQFLCLLQLWSIKPSL